MIYNIIMIIVVVAFIIDYSGIISKLNIKVYQLFNKTPYNGFKLPLISCSLCVTFWLVLYYMFVITFNYDRSYLIESLFIASISAFSVQFVTQLLYLIKEIFSYLIRHISIIAQK